MAHVRYDLDYVSDYYYAQKAAGQPILSAKSSLIFNV